MQVDLSMMISCWLAVSRTVKSFSWTVTKINYQSLSRPIYEVKTFVEPRTLELIDDVSDLKMDWSSPREILAIGGHKRINDQQCTNEILFYTRRGEFLHRTHIPHTVMKNILGSELSSSPRGWISERKSMTQARWVSPWLNACLSLLESTIICSVLGTWQW